MAHAKAAHIKHKVVEETERMLVYTVYLTLVLGSFAIYRRLVLAEYEINYFNYGAAVIEALILAKVILIGEAFHFGERYSGRPLPLIVPTVYKSVVFGLLVAVFFVLEHFVTGAIHRDDLAQIWADLFSKGRNEMIGKVIMMTVAFLPFFAFRELEKTFGGVDFMKLFFHRPAAESSQA